MISAPVRNVQHPPNLQQCHPFLRVFLMPLNSTDFNQNLNIVPTGHVQTIHNVIKDTSPSQEVSSSNPIIYFSGTPLKPGKYGIFIHTSKEL